MKLSTAGHHALRIMMDLALHSGEGPVLRQTISERQQISTDYIAQLFRRLNRAGLIKSVMGPGGGYTLAHPAQDIRVGDVIRAIEGPVATSFCVEPSPAGHCMRKETCTLHNLWLELSKIIDGFLNSYTLQDLCDRSTTTLETLILSPPLRCPQEEPIEVVH